MQSAQDRTPRRGRVCVLLRGLIAAGLAFTPVQIDVPALPYVDPSHDHSAR
jgi:hypothetical protein